MPDRPLANEQGQIDPVALRERINAALKVTEPTQPVYRPWRLRLERTDDGLCLICPCGKKRALDIAHINVFVRTFNTFIEEHSWCEPGDAA